MLRTENLLTMIGVWVFIGAVGKVLPKTSDTAGWARLQPLAPLILCAAAVWIPGLQPAEMGAGTRIMLALCLGFGVGHVHKIIRQTGFGDDERIEAKREARESASDNPR
jgi:hypothetical protein